MTTRPPEEMELHRKGLEYETRFFEDMRLEAPAVQRALLKHEAEMPDGTWQTCYDEVDISLCRWIWKYATLEDGIEGQCDWHKKEIRINRGQTGTDLEASILHEMIHAFEESLSPGFREWLLLYLYRRLGKRIPAAKLNRMIDTSTHIVLHARQHGVLFLLKSLDIDARMKWPWGTTFAYGRADFFSPRKKTDA